MSQKPPQIAPLTAQQQYFLHVYERCRGGNFNICVGLRLLGTLDVELLRRSLEIVVSRHDALRTRIEFIDGAPKQRIDYPGYHHLAAELFSYRSEIEVNAIRRGSEEFLNGLSDLAGSTLFGSKLLRISTTEHILLVRMDHLIFDGLSTSILFDELWHSYGALSRNQPLDLPEVKKQYSDYAKWQEGTRLNRFTTHGTHWRDRLESIPLLQFPVRKSLDQESATRSKEGLLHLPFRFDEPFTSGVYATAQRQCTVPAMIVLTSFIALLSWRRPPDFE
jgi:Condensation domain